APRPPGLNLITVGQPKLVSHGRHCTQQLPLTLFCMRRPRLRRVNSILKGGNDERVEFVAACEMLADDFSCTPAKLIGGHVAFEVALEQVLHQLPLEAMPTA